MQEKEQKNQSLYKNADKITDQIEKILKINQELIDKSFNICYTVSVGRSWEVQPSLKNEFFKKGGGYKCL